MADSIGITASRRRSPRLCALARAVARPAVATAVMLYLSLPSGQAQTPAISADSARRHAVNRLKPGTPVRVFAAGARLEGTLGQVAGDSLFLKGDSLRAVAVPVATVDSLWEQRNHAGIGALVGA